MADLTEAVAAAAVPIWRESNPSYPIRECNAWDECKKLAREVLDAAAPIIERQIRAEVAESIAQAIEVAGRDPHRNLAWMYPDEAAAIARGYTQPAETPGHRDGTPAAPVQPTQERPLS